MSSDYNRRVTAVVVYYFSDAVDYCMENYHVSPYGHWACENNAASAGGHVHDFSDVASDDVHRV